jgi:hypothetical protein
MKQWLRFIFHVVKHLLLHHLLKRSFFSYQHLYQISIGCFLTIFQACFQLQLSKFHILSSWMDSPACHSMDLVSDFPSPLFFPRAQARMEPRASCILGKSSTTELHPQLYSPLVNRYSEVYFKFLFCFCFM